MPDSINQPVEKHTREWWSCGSPNCTSQHSTEALALQCPRRVRQRSYCDEEYLKWRDEYEALLHALREFGMTYGAIGRLAGKSAQRIRMQLQQYEQRHKQ